MYSLKKIADGVRVVSVETEKYKTAEIVVSMALPLDENNASDALALYLLKRSCKEYKDYTLLNKRLEELYGAMLSASVSKQGDSKILELSIFCLDDKFSLDGESIIGACAELLVKILFEPNVKNNSFGTENLKAEKRRLIQALADEKDDKRGYARGQLIKKMCSNEPFGLSRIGTEEEINAVKMTDVVSSWKKMLSSSFIQITSVGSISIDKVSEIFEKKFSKIERTPYVPETIFVKKCTKFKRAEEFEPINQGKLVIGYRSGSTGKDDKLFERKVMVDILGGGTYSKLFTVIREKMSLCYYCSASFISTKGIIIIDAGIDTNKEKAVTAGIVKQLCDIREGRFDDEVLEACKRSFRERMTISSPEGIVSWYESQIFEETPINPEEAIEQIEKVTKEDVKECAKQMTLDTVFMLSSEDYKEDSLTNNMFED